MPADIRIPEGSATNICAILVDGNIDRTIFVRFVIDQGTASGELKATAYINCSSLHSQYLVICCNVHVHIPSNIMTYIFRIVKNVAPCTVAAFNEQHTLYF